MESERVMLCVITRVPLSNAKCSVCLCVRQGSVHPNHPSSHVVAHLPSGRPPTCVRLSPSSSSSSSSSSSAVSFSVLFCCAFAVFDWKKSEATMEGMANPLLCVRLLAFHFGTAFFPFSMRSSLLCFVFGSLSLSLFPLSNTQHAHSTAQQQHG